MKMRIRGIHVKTVLFGVLSYLLGCFLVGLLFQNPSLSGIVETLESFIYFQTFSSTARPNENLVMIDEKDKVYDRSVFAEIISGLDRQGARVIGFDVLFAGEGDARQDALLADATRRAGSKVIHAAEFYGIQKTSIIPDRLQLQVRFRSASPGFIEGVRGVSLPYSRLLEASSALGNITSKSDIAGRGDQYFPLLISYSDRIYPSLPLLSALRFRGHTDDSLLVVEEDRIVFGSETNRLTIPVDLRSQLLINFIPPADFSGKVFSVDEALTLMADRSKPFNGKLVLIGNSFESQEQMKGPHFQSYPVFFVYASIVSQILNGQNISEGIIESLFAGFALVILGLCRLFFIRSNRLKIWILPVLGFFLLLALSHVMMTSRIRLYILAPYLVFCITLIASNRYYRHLLSRIKTVFISYSSKDLDFTKKLAHIFEKNNILTLVDYKMSPGKDLMKFVGESIRRSDYTVLVVSKNSLDSDWVYVEFMETMAHEHVMETKKFLPLCIDTGVFDRSYQAKLVNDLMTRLDAVSDSIRKLREKNLPAESFEHEGKRIKEHQFNLDKMLTHINGALAIDLSTNQNFDENISRVIKRIKKGTT